MNEFRRRHRVHRTCVWVATAAAVAALGSCGTDGPDGSVSDRADTAHARPSSMLTDSGVGVVAEGCNLVAVIGSGVVVEQSGQVATAAHTIRGATTITVIDADGVEHTAAVTSFDKDADLALLDAPTLDAPPLPIGTTATGPGTLVTWRRASGVTQQAIDVTRRLRISIEDIYSVDVVERTGFEISGPIAIGQSGGGVIDANGDVIGVVYAASKDRGGVGFATDDAELADLIAHRDTSGSDNGRCG